MKPHKIKSLTLAVTAVMLIGMLGLPIFASGGEPELQEKARLYYNSKVCFFILPVQSKENAVCYREKFNRQDQIHTIKINGRPSEDLEISIHLSFDEKQDMESSQFIKIEEGVRTETEFHGVMTGIQYLKNHQLKVGEKEELNVLSEGETYRLLIKIKGRENMVIDNIPSLVYLTEVTLEDKNGHQIHKVEIWFIKGGKLDGYIAKFKMRIGFRKLLWLELTLNKIKQASKT